MRLTGPLCPSTTTYRHGPDPPKEALPEEADSPTESATQEAIHYWNCIPTSHTWSIGLTICTLTVLGRTHPEKLQLLSCRKATASAGGISTYCDDALLSSMYAPFSEGEPLGLACRLFPL